MEKQILEAINDAVSKSIITALTGYNSPLNKLCEEVVSKHRDDLFAMLDAEVAGLKTTPEFKAAIKDALNHKLAKLMVAKMEGELEKRVNDLRAQPGMRARIVLAVENIIKDNAQCLTY